MILSAPKLPSNRRFGALFTAVFLGFAAWACYKHGFTLSVAVLTGLGLLTAALTLLAPHLLAPFNKAWFHFGQLLGKIVSPVVLGVIFFGLLTPVGVVARLFGRNELRLGRSAAASYWIDRNPPGPPPNSFTNQW